MHDLHEFIGPVLGSKIDVIICENGVPVSLVNKLVCSVKISRVIAPDSPRWLLYLLNIRLPLKSQANTKMERAFIMVCKLRNGGALENLIN